MRIVSKIHDYYDGLSDGSDKSLTFVRHPRDVEIPQPQYEYRNYIHTTLFRDNKFEYVLDQDVVCFCGVIYPYIKVTKIYIPVSGVVPDEVTYCYDIATFNECIPDHFMVNWRLLSGHLDNKDSVKLWLVDGITHFSAPTYVKRTVKTKKSLLDLFTNLRVAYYVFTNQGGNVVIDIYPILKNYQFYKVFDAPTAIQRIEMFLTNELAPLDRMKILPIPDKLKAQAHGFNKFSFRKDPTSKKR